MTNKEVAEYEKSLKDYRDWYSCISTAENKGIKKGRKEGRDEREAELKIEYAIKLLKKGMPPDEVAEITGLTLEEIMKILAELKREGYIE